MFGKAADRQQSIERTGSHSTKPFATGRVEVLPPEAQPWAEIYLSLAEQRRTIHDQVQHFEDKLAECNIQLLQTLPRQQFEAVKLRRAAFVSKLETLKASSGELRRDCQSAMTNTLAGSFMFAAQRMLTAEMYAAILEAAEKETAETRKAMQEAGMLDVNGKRTVFQASSHTMAVERQREQKPRLTREERDRRYSDKSGTVVKRGDDRLVHREF